MKRRRESAHPRTQDQRRGTIDTNWSNVGGKAHSWSLLYLEEGTRPCYVPIKKWHLDGQSKGTVQPPFLAHLFTLIRHLSSLILFFFFSLSLSFRWPNPVRVGGLSREWWYYIVRRIGVCHRRCGCFGGGCGVVTCGACPRSFAPKGKNQNLHKL